MTTDAQDSQGGGDKIGEVLLVGCWRLKIEEHTPLPFQKLLFTSLFPAMQDVDGWLLVVVGVIEGSLSGATPPPPPVYLSWQGYFFGTRN